MELIKNLGMNFIANFMKPETTTNTSDQSETNKKKNPLHKNSLAYLVYKNRKKKGLISNETNECPKIFFGDEWAF